MTEPLPVTGAGLLPCPFCGGEASVIGIRDGQQVTCKGQPRLPCFAKGPAVYHGPRGWAACEADAIAAWNTRASTPSTGAVPEGMREALIELLTVELGDSYDCGRVWSAWGYGTMGEDDFSPVNDRVEEIAAAIIALPAPVPATREGWICVPVEPTEAMLAEYNGLRMTRIDGDMASSIWSAMLAAAPTAPSDIGDGWRTDMEAALEEAAIWHDGESKALSKQPPSGDTGWRRLQHQEQAAALRAAIPAAPTVAQGEGK